MKATIEFYLPEESEEHKMAVHVMDYYAAIWDMYQELRHEYKYGRDALKTERVYDRFFEIIEENNVRLF